MNPRIAIIGGGAAGMMAALTVQELCPQAKVMLFEKNTYLGAKVIISGGGRCNVTTGIKDVRQLLQNYPRGAKFLMSAMFRFPPQAVMDWFEEHGVPLKTEEDLRVFPKSDSGKDVVGALEKALEKAGVEIHVKANIIAVTKENENFILTVKDEAEKSGQSAGATSATEPLIHTATALIVTTGGNAYRHTGSTGDGYAFAKALGHTVTPLAPSLNSFFVAESWVSTVAGVSFEQVKMRAFSHNGKDIFERTGPMVFTHKGVSGPAVFALSSASAYENYSKEKPMKLEINFFPQEKKDIFTKRIEKIMEEHNRKTTVNFLDIILPHSFCKPFAQTAQLQADKQVAQINREEKNRMLDMLQAFPFQVTGRGAGDEFVTAGGVPLSEVNTNTMESKICRRLYFAGEILDIDGYTGGFNLQASWATGRLAGESFAAACADELAPGE